jgi:hypothetical protein
MKMCFRWWRRASSTPFRTARAANVRISIPSPPLASIPPNARPSAGRGDLPKRRAQRQTRPGDGAGAGQHFASHQMIKLEQAAAGIQRRTRDGFLGSFFRLCLRNSAHSRCAGGKVAPSAAPFAVRFIPAGPRLSPRMRRTSPRFSNRRAARLMSTKLVPSSSRRRRRRWRCNKSARPPGAFPLLARCQVARNMNR